MDCLQEFFPCDIVWIIVKKLLPDDIYSAVMEELKREFQFQDTIRLLECEDELKFDKCYKASFISVTNEILKYYKGYPSYAFFPTKIEKVTVIEYYKNLRR